MRHVNLGGRGPWRPVLVIGVLVAGSVVALAPVTVAENPVTQPATATGVVGTPEGFATLSAWGQNGTTGGAGGPTVSVDTASEFLDSIARQGPLTIQVDGMIDLPGPMHNVTSDKTIVGLGADSGLTGGGLNIGLPADDGVTSPPGNEVHNVIVQNLTFDDWADDAVNVQMFSHHVWIDHNTFVGGFDGAVDVKRGSSYVTISWNHSTHGKNMLVGHSPDNAAQDKGRLNITYHHNWFDGTVERNPWVRFGNPAHVYNNYYLNISKYGVRSSSDAGILVEGNYFQGVVEPFQLDVVGTQPGSLVSRKNCFADSGDPQTGGSVKRIPYEYTLQPCEEVPATVTAGAGAGRLPVVPEPAPTDEPVGWAAPATSSNAATSLWDPACRTAPEAKSRRTPTSTHWTLPVTCRRS